MKHWIFHKYKWETTHTAPLFVRGLFSDSVWEKRYQTGSCECGAWKIRAIDVDTELEHQIAFDTFILAESKRLWKEGKHDIAIRLLSPTPPISN